MVQPSSKVSYGKITPVFNPLKDLIRVSFSWNYNWNKINVPISNFWLYTNLKALVKILTEFWGFHLIKIWARKSSIIFGLWKTMESLIMLWLVSVLPQRKWERLHTHFSVATIPHKFKAELRVSRLSRILPIGLELGLLKDKEWLMAQKQCNYQDKIQAIQPSLIQEAPNYPSHLMFLKKLEWNGRQLYQNLIANQIKHSAIFKNPAKMLPQKWNR